MLVLVFGMSEKGSVLNVIIFYVDIVDVSGDNFEEDVFVVGERSFVRGYFGEVWRGKLLWEMEYEWDCKFVFDIILDVFVLFRVILKCILLY